VADAVGDFVIDPALTLLAMQRFRADLARIGRLHRFN
jgi:hypothetical protein